MNAALPPVALLHGCGGTSEATFTASGWIEALARSGRRAFTVALPGHGGGPQSHDPAAYGDLSVSLLRALPTEAVDLVGFSLGAKLALDIAVRFPERLRRVVVGGVGDNLFGAEPFGEEAAAAIARGDRESQSPAIDFFLRGFDAEQNDRHAIAAVLRRPPNPRFSEEVLSRIGCPVLLVNGDSDPVAVSTERLVAALRPERSLTVEGAAHFDLTSRREFLDAATDFLNSAHLREDHNGVVR